MNIARGFGWKKDPHDPRDRMHARRHGLTRIEGRRMDELAGPPLNQGGFGACVGHLGVELLQMFYAVQGRTITQLSPWHAYWLARAVDEYQYEDGGAYIRSCMKAMQHVGCGPHSMFPFDPFDKDAPINERPPQDVENAGIRFADFNYERIIGGPEAVLDALQSGHPVGMGTNVTSAFVFCSGDETIPAPKRGEARQGGHAFLLCGFDRFGARIRMKNSWGNDWGDGGYAWLDPAWIDDSTTQDVIAITAVKEAA